MLCVVCCAMFHGCCVMFDVLCVEYVLCGVLCIGCF